MNALVEVLKDLYHFTITERLGLRALPLAPQRPLLQANAEVRTETKSASEPPAHAVGVLGTEAYVTIPETPLHLFPTETFDGVVTYLSYGSSVLVRLTQGKYAQVQIGAAIGWVLREALNESQRAIWPQLVSGTCYEADHAETVKLRSVIKDEFYAAPLERPLQSVEFVYYKLVQKKRIIQWPKTRPRIGGTWQQHLRGLSGIHIGVLPKTGSVLERVHEDGTGRVSYVEAVFPDQAIRISEIDDDSSGYYRETTVPSAEWREWRPVFIEVL